MVQYTDDLVAGIEWMWGEGFLSPGGPAEVRALLEGVDLTDQRVLDVGSGLGAIDLLLAREHGAGQVVGIEVEPQLIERADEAAARAGLSERVRFVYVEPGPFPFEDGSFEVVFSKDSMIHIPDKPALYKEVLRVLAPGGLFVASDWLYGGGPEMSRAMRDWLAIIHLKFAFETPAKSAEALGAAGFRDVSVRQRNTWYRAEMKRELASLTGANFQRLVAALGREAAEHRRKSSTIKQAVVDSGELCPCHLRGRKAG